jgi:hypothetical protein
MGLDSLDNVLMVPVQLYNSQSEDEESLRCAYQYATRGRPPVYCALWEDRDARHFKDLA